MDEGLLAYGAERVMEGQLPNRDFVSPQPPLSYYSAAFFFKLFGTSLASLRILGVSIYISIALLIYGITRNFNGPIWSLAAALPATILGVPFFNFVPFAVWQGITATLASVLLFLRAGVRQQSYLAFGAGVLNAISILLRHDQGLYLTLSILAFAIALKFTPESRASLPKPGRLLLWWGSGLLTVAIPLGIFWWVKRAWGKMFSQLVVFPLSTYAKTSSRSYPHWNTHVAFSENAVTLLFYISPVLQAAILIWLLVRVIRRQYRLPEAVMTFLLVWAALFYLQGATRSDWHHLLITLPPLFILVSCACRFFVEKLDDLSSQWSVARWPAKITKGTPRALAGAVLIWFLWAVTPACLPDLTNKTALPIPRGQVRIEGGERMANFIQLVQKAAAPDRSILSLPYYPILYFLSERRNPTQWNYLWPGDQTTEDHKALIEQAKKDPPALIVIVKEKEMRFYAPLILDYVHNNYRLAGDSGELAVYLPEGKP